MQLEDSRPRWGILWIFLLLLAGAASIPFFLMKPKVLPSYEIQNFMGKVEVYSTERKAWNEASRGQAISVMDKIRTGPGSEVDLRIPDQIRIRIKENSEAEIRKPHLLDRALRHRLHLLRGSLLGSTEKDFEGQKLEVSTPTLVAAVRGTTFQIEANPETNESAVRVLQGSVKVRGVKSHKSVIVRTLEKTEVKGGAVPLDPIRVSRDEWSRLKEAYELTEKSAFLEARQLDLSKQGGSLFKYVFDHGTFYTPEFGHADREFIEDKSSGKVYVKIDYDVFPTGSFVGMYIKTRDLDLAKFKSLEFQARVNPEEGYPESLKIEVKTATAITRAFVPREFKNTWASYKYPLRFNRPAPITEIALVFSNEKVGNYKKGTLYLRDFNLEPLTEAELAKASVPADTTQPS